MENQEINTNENLVEALTKMKETTVPKEKYEEVVKQNKDLIDSILEGRSASEVPAEEEVNIDEIRETLFGAGSQNLSNYDYAKNALKLRNALIEQGKEDPFVPQGHKIEATAEDREGAERTAQVLQECIDYADSCASNREEAFVSEFGRRLK